MTPGLWKVTPDERSTDMIHAICSAVASPEDLDNLHVTLAFDMNNPDNHIETSTGTFQALITGVELFGPNADVLVLTLESEDLQKEFSRIHANPNVKFEYLPYRPHMTIIKRGATNSMFECLNDIINAPGIPTLAIALGEQTRTKLDARRNKSK